MARMRSGRTSMRGTGAVRNSPAAYARPDWSSASALAGLAADVHIRARDATRHGRPGSSGARGLEGDRVVTPAVLADGDRPLVLGGDARSCSWCEALPEAAAWVLDGADSSMEELSAGEAADRSCDPHGPGRPGLLARPDPRSSGGRRAARARLTTPSEWQARTPARPRHPRSHHPDVRRRGAAGSKRCASSSRSAVVALSTRLPR